MIKKKNYKWTNFILVICALLFAGGCGDSNNAPSPEEELKRIALTQKIAISMPADLVEMIDIISKKKGMSRSRFISIVLHEKVLNEKERQIKEVYNRVFSDDSIKKEQLETSLWFDGAGNKEGLEW